MYTIRFAMKRYLLSTFSLVFAALLLSACSGRGSSASPPTNVTALAGDSSITVSWNGTPGVQYWVFFAPSANVTPQNCSSIAGCQIIVNPTTPLVISAPVNGGSSGFTTNGTVTGLTNGTIYSLSINGRTGGGSGGAGSASVSAVPRLAGTSWTAGSGVNAANAMHGVTNGLVNIAGVNTNVFLAVGGNTSIYTSTDGNTWAAPASGVLPTSNLNATASYGTTYLAAGTGGVILSSVDTVTWTQPATGTGVTSDLYGLASNGGGGFVAVGAGGTIIYSGNSGATWTTATSGTTNALYSVSYVNGMYVAVGAAGTLLTSPDGANWTTIPALTAADLKSVAYGGQTLSGGVYSGTNTYVVVGVLGTLITSTNAAANGVGTWILQTPIAASPNLNALTYGHQFVAAGDGGVIYTSTDGFSWQSQTSGTGAALYTIAHRPFDYAIVGAAGLILNSK
jgi:hypothetical protein